MDLLSMKVGALPMVAAWPLLAVISTPPALARIIVTDPGEERGHIVVIDQIEAAAVRFFRLDDTGVGTSRRAGDADPSFEHA